ncbi:MAG: hypothetical protein OXM57_05160 [bacterium]|nr:hypothetical protein [bacterium]
MSRQRTLAPDVERVLETWQPHGWAETDRRLLEPLMDTVRGWVSAAGPENAERARWQLRCTASLVVWVYRHLGTCDVRTVLHPANVEHWTMEVNSHRSGTWRDNARSALRAVGRAANPREWPSPSRQVGRTGIATPYTAKEELAFRRAAKLPGRQNRPERLWILAAALGGGLNGKEITVAHVDDLFEVDTGRLAVRVRGKNPRLTPIRHQYTDIAHQALQRTGEGRFIPAGGRNLVYNICARLDPGGGEGLALRRARSTWLVAHIQAGTPLPVLKQVAGRLSMNTLDGLLGHIENTLDDTETAREALRA